MSISCHETVQLADALHANQRMLMSIQLQNTVFHVGVPHENFEIKTTGNQDLVPLGVRHLSNSLRVTQQLLFGRLCEFFEQTLLFYVFVGVLREVVLQVFIFVIFAFLFRLFRPFGLSQVPQKDPIVVAATRQLIDVF